MGIHERIELQAEVRAPREEVFRLVSTAEGLAAWLDGAHLDDTVGGEVRLELREATAFGTILSLQPPQHISWTFDWEGAPLGEPTVLAFDAIDHGKRTHLTLRHVGLRDARQRAIHAELWRYWFERLCAAADSVGTEATRAR
jgi:uncharacterized protein YndB with AHSA1/START domain